MAGENDAASRSHHEKRNEKKGSTVESSHSSLPADGSDENLDRTLTDKPMRVFAKTIVSKLAGAIKHELLRREDTFDIETCGRVPVATAIRAISLAKDYVFGKEKMQTPSDAIDLAVSVGFKDFTTENTNRLSLMTLTVGGVSDPAEIISEPDPEEIENDGSPVLTVSKGTSVPKLAGLISSILRKKPVGYHGEKDRIFDGSELELRAIGSEPINIAVRGIRLAELFLNGDDVLCRLLFKPIFAKVETHEDEKAVYTQARLRVKIVYDQNDNEH